LDDWRNSAGGDQTGQMMKSLLTIVGVLLVFSGVVWFLQGINVLPGSFMTGQTKWAIIGGATFVAGALLLVIGRRLGRRPRPPR
jgi:hypothetical protein